MKKLISSILVLALLCALLTGCQSDKTESSEPKLAAEAQKEKAESEASAAAEERKDQDVLRVVTDLDCYSEVMGEKSQARLGKTTFAQILKYFGGTPSGMAVELEILPLNQTQAGAYDAELTHLRTEIAAGGGPDVFLMSGFGTAGSGLPDNTLFQNPEAAMKKGLFLPLDEYIESAEHMEFDKLDETVMAAGRNEQGQVILPMFYRMDEAVVAEADPPVPASWDEGLASEDERIREVYARGLVWGSFRDMCFGQIADNLNEELLLDQDHFYQRVKEAIDLLTPQVPKLRGYEEFRDNTEYFSNVDSYMSDWPGYVPVQTFSSFVFRNEDGGVNAAIETWCAVNRNTKHPEDAFYIVDCLMSKEFLGQEAFWVKEFNGDYDSRQMRFFYMAGEFFVPVHTDLLSGGTEYKYKVNINQQEKDVLGAARKDISCAYFTTNADRELITTVYEMVWRVYEGETLTDEDIRKATDKCYSTMKMMLAES